MKIPRRVKKWLLCYCNMSARHNRLAGRWYGFDEWDGMDAMETLMYRRMR